LLLPVSLAVEGYIVVIVTSMITPNLDMGSVLIGGYRAIVLIVAPGCGPSGILKWNPVAQGISLFLLH
jgi:hypothetical protein